MQTLHYNWADAIASAGLMWGAFVKCVLHRAFKLEEGLDLSCLLCRGSMPGDLWIDDGDGGTIARYSGSKCV